MFENKFYWYNFTRWKLFFAESTRSQNKFLIDHRWPTRRQVVLSVMVIVAENANGDISHPRFEQIGSFSLG